MLQFVMSNLMLVETW